VPVWCPKLRAACAAAVSHRAHSDRAPVASMGSTARWAAYFPSILSLRKTGHALYRTPPKLLGPTGRKTPAVGPIAPFLYRQGKKEAVSAVTARCHSQGIVLGKGNPAKTAFNCRVGLLPGRKRVLPHGSGRVSAATLSATLILDATRRCRPFVAGAAFHPVGQFADVPGRAVHSVPERRVRQFLASHVKIVSLSEFRKQAIRVEGRYWVSLAIGLPRLLATMVSTFHLSSARWGTRCST